MAKYKKAAEYAPEAPESNARHSYFISFSSNVARFAGRPVTFIIAVLLIVVWAATGPIFDYSETWQLVVNTGTTIITFLMVFLIQNTQNRDASAVQLKLDEIIRASRGAHTELLDIEDLSEERLFELRDLYGSLAKQARVRVARGEAGTDCPDIELPNEEDAADGKKKADSEKADA